MLQHAIDVTSFILGYCRRKDVDSASKVFMTMRQKGCRSNEVSYNNLSIVFVKLRRWMMQKSFFCK